MKRWIYGTIIVTMLVLLIPSIVNSLSSSLPASVPSESDDSSLIVISPVYNDITISMYDHNKKEIILIPLEEYLLGVVAAEMPASFELDALKAQAVAARTLVIYKMRSMGGRGCNQNQGADVCSSFAHCQAWITDVEKRKNWGENYQNNIEKIRRAVQETRGEIITYQGKPIEVFYFATSNGKTEESGAVFSNSLPYYKVVNSEGEEDAPKFTGSFTFGNREFVNIFKQSYPQSRITANNISSQIHVNSYTQSGRVREITVGGVKLTGTQFRLLYGLYSTDMSFVFASDTLTIRTRGFGHGVGMSQVGADRMAQRGYQYKEILKHYYQGVSIEKY